MMDTDEFGYSIAELLIVVSISLGLIGLALPHFRTPSLKPEAQALAVQLQSLAVRALQSEEKIILLPTGNKLEAGSSLTAWKKQYTVAQGISLSQHPVPIVFYPEGVCSPSELELSKQSRTCTLTISLRCRVRLTCSS